jgi:hypothetical protein
MAIWLALFVHCGGSAKRPRGLEVERQFELDGEDWREQPLEARKRAP